MKLTKKDGFKKSLKNLHRVLVWAIFISLEISIPYVIKYLFLSLLCCLT